MDCLLNNVEVMGAEPNFEEHDLAEIALHEYQEHAVMKADYMDIRFLIPSSNDCEILFSVAKRGLLDCRKNIDPDSF